MGLPWLRVRQTTPRVLLLGVYGLFAYHFCFLLALRLAPPIEANLINYLWPILVVFLSPWFLPGTVLRARHVAGALLGFSGAAWLVTEGKLSLSSDHATGYLLAFSAALIWSTYSLMTKRVTSFPTSSVAMFCLVSGVLALLGHWTFDARYVLYTGRTDYAAPVIGISAQRFIIAQADASDVAVLCAAGRELEGYDQLWDEGRHPHDSFMRSIAVFLVVTHRARRAALQTVAGLREIGLPRDVAVLIGKMVYATRTDAWSWWQQSAHAEEPAMKKRK